MEVRAIQTLEAIANLIYEAGVRGPGFVRVEIHQEGFRVVCCGEREDKTAYETVGIVGWAELANDAILGVGQMILVQQGRLTSTGCA
jgi:hypothetical protein